MANGDDGVKVARIVREWSDGYSLGWRVVLTAAGTELAIPMYFGSWPRAVREANNTLRMIRESE